MVALPTVGFRTLVTTKSSVTFSLITILVAPVFEILAASSAKSSSRSAVSGVTATWVAAGSLAQSFSTPTSTPSDPTRPMQ